MRKVLKKSFFNRKTMDVANDLLGKFLVSQDGKEVLITEVEIYDGFKDSASHANRGKTPRNEVMFDEAGIFYIYLVYGMHYMLNIVTREKGYPAAILIRGGKCRNKNRNVLLNGPAKITKYFGIKKDLNYKKVTRDNGIWFEDRGYLKNKINKSPRIGVKYASDFWRNRKLRFWI